MIKNNKFGSHYEVTILVKKVVRRFQRNHEKCIEEVVLSVVETLIERL